MPKVVTPDPRPLSLSPMGNMTAGRLGHTATLLPKGGVLIAGGYNDGGGFLSSAEIYEL